MSLFREERAGKGRDGIGQEVGAETKTRRKRERQREKSKNKNKKKTALYEIPKPDLESTIVAPARWWHRCGPLAANRIRQPSPNKGKARGGEGRGRAWPGEDVSFLQKIDWL